MSSRLFCTTLFVLFSAASATTLGVTYNPGNPNLPPPKNVVSVLESLHISAVRVLNPTPDAVRAFAYTNITLLLSVPNGIISSFAANRSAASLWLLSHVVPYHPRTLISLISAGSGFITTAAADPTLEPSTVLFAAMRNLHLSLLDHGIRTISVSTTFSFIDIMTTAFPPSAAEFQEPLGSSIIHPLLQFLEETNSSFLISIYPYNIYRIKFEIPIGFALFQNHPFNFRDDVITEERYCNLFDMMIDAVIAAMAISGQENVPVIVAETGWPDETRASPGGNYAEIYLKGLVTHLRSGIGTPLRKGGASEAYIYELFDDEGRDLNGSTVPPIRGGAEEKQHWGIMHQNLSTKYSIDFSASTSVLPSGKTLVEVTFASVVSLLMFL